MKEVRRELKEIVTKVTTIETQVPNLVTESSLMSSVQTMKEDSRAHTDAVAKDLKDRMDGRREITGVHRTVPEIWNEQAANPAFPTAFNDPPKKPTRGFRYWVTLSAAILALGGAVYGIFSFAAQTLERQERLEQLLRERPVPAEVEPGHKTATAMAEQDTND
jgi:hypothetical protein